MARWGKDKKKIFKFGELAAGLSPAVGKTRVERVLQPAAWGGGRLPDLLPKPDY